VTPRDAHASCRSRSRRARTQVADLAATTLSNIGLLYITVSVYQMLRGAVILWNTLFGVLFLGKKLNRLHYAGLLLAVTGIVIVGTASLLTEHAKSGGGMFAPPPLVASPPPPAWSPPPPLGPSLAPYPAPAPPAGAWPAGVSLRAALSPRARTAALEAGDPDAASARWVILGMGMIIVSQLIQAAGMTMEEFLLRKYELASTQLVGYEGGVGMLLMLGIFLPVRARSAPACAGMAPLLRALRC
jgi:drug/metabolite transporter (DMT)-like permease